MELVTKLQLMKLFTIGSVFLFEVPYSEPACFTEFTNHSHDYVFSHRATHFTNDGEVLPILLEGSVVYRPTLDFLNNIVVILATEVMGYADVGIVKSMLYNPTETSLALDRLVGCDNIMDSCQNKRPVDAPAINMAMWMSSLVPDESWPSVGTSEIMYNGYHALYGRYGWFVSTDIVRTMWEGSNVVGDHWRSLQNLNYVSALSLSGSYLGKNSFANLSSAYCHRPECVRGIFHPPWCNNQTSMTSDCAVLFSDYSELNFMMLSSQILELRLSVKVAWVGPYLRNLVRRMTDRKQPVLFFALTPHDLLQYSSFSRISFPTCSTPQYVEGDYEIGGCDYTWYPLTKVTWSAIEINAPPLSQLIQNIFLDDDLINSAFSEYAQMGDEVEMEEYVCHWIKNNQMEWLNWLPADSLSLKRQIFLPAVFPNIQEGEDLYGIYLGATMAVDSVNEADILPSVRIDMLPYGTQCESEKTLDMYSGLIQDNIKPLAGFVGPCCSLECENLSGVSKYFNQIIISYFADSVTLGAKDKHPFVFRVFPDMEEISFATEQIFQYFGWTNFAVITDTTVNMYTDPAAVADHLLRTGMQCVYSSTIDGQSVEEMVAHIKASQPQVIFEYCSEELAQELICEAYKQHITLENDYLWILPSWYSDEWWDVDKLNTSHLIGCTSAEIKKALNGGITLSRFSFAEPEDVIAGDVTMASWMEEHSRDLAKTNTSFTPLAAYSYDVVWTFAFALHRLLEADITYLDSIQSLKTTMLLKENLENTSFVGATGLVDFIQQDRRTPVTISLYLFDFGPNQVDLGQYIPVSGTANDGELYLDEQVLNMVRQHFDAFSEKQEIKVCGIEHIRVLLGSSCASAYIVICLFFTIILLIMALCIGLLFKKKYDKKVKAAELRMKELGLLNLGMDSLSTLDKWELPRENIILNRKLGEGAFGTVYGGEAFLEGQNWVAVAVKTLKMGSSIEEKLDFLSEAEMMKRFDHKNIIRLLGVCTKGEPLYAVMDFMLYGDLKTFLLARRHLVGQMSQEAEVLHPARLTSMVHDIASGLDYLAKHSYIHRDLACRNCLVDASYCIKIGDFGMTRALYDSDYYRLCKQGRLPVRWMAPESVAEGIFTTMSDIWSLGVVIYEVVTCGGFPYADMSNTAVLDYIKDGNSMYPPEHCPTLLSSLMMQCWVIEAAIRPTAEEVMDLLETNPELIVPCLSGPHESVSVDGLSRGTFSPGVSSRHSFRSWDADFASETSSGGIRSSFGSLRRALQNSITKKSSKKKNSIKLSPTLSRKGDLDWTNDLFARQERKRSSERSAISWSFELHSKMKPVVSEFVRCGRNGPNSLALQRFNSCDGVLNVTDVNPARSYTQDESFQGLSKKVEAFQNEYCRQPQIEVKHSEVKLRADSAPLIPKVGRRSQRKSRSKSIASASLNLGYERGVAVISGNTIRHTSD